eukprot:831462-Amphidinium_carterae.1
MSRSDIADTWEGFGTPALIDTLWASVLHSLLVRQFGCSWRWTRSVCGNIDLTKAIGIGAVLLSRLLFLLLERLMLCIGVMQRGGAGYILMFSPALFVLRVSSRVSEIRMDKYLADLRVQVLSSIIRNVVCGRVPETSRNPDSRNTKLVQTSR